MKIFFDSHVGKRRQNNEDNVKSVQLFEDGYLLIVADGVGGEKKGEVASELAVIHIENYLKEHIDELKTGLSAQCIEQIKNAIFHANFIIREMASQEEYYKMATTVVLAFVYKNRVWVANVGDSRCYLYYDENGKKVFKQITIDHTFVQELMDKGILTAEEASRSREKNTITRAVGAEYELDIDIFEFDLHKKDRLMLCSDGLSDMLSKEEIYRIIEKKDDVQNLVVSLIQKSLEKGGKDNITVLCAEK